MLNVCWRQFSKLEKKKQYVVARSSVKVEFKSMAHRICESMWPRSLKIVIIKLLSTLLTTLSITTLSNMIELNTLNQTDTTLLKKR